MNWLIPVLIVAVVVVIICVLAFVIYIASKAKNIKIGSKPIKVKSESDIAGEKGEIVVKSQLNKLARDSNYKIYNDLMFKTHNGVSHQLDHLVVSKYGIFVIETKNWSGSISGSDDSEEWTSVKFDGTQKHLKNPVKQNEGHIYALNEVLRLSEDDYISVICFISPDKCNIKSNVLIVNELQLNGAIKKYKKRIFSNKEVAAINRKITNLEDALNYSAEEHIANINKHHSKN